MGNDVPVVLVVDPCADLSRCRALVLQQEGFVTVEAASGEAAVVAVLGPHPPDLVLLAALLPGRHGTDVCRSLRDVGYSGGLVVLKAGASELERVAGLDAGADDYLSEPASVAELVARVRAVVRRVERWRLEVATTPSGLRVEVDRAHVSARFRGTELPLGPRQLDVLAHLVRRRGRVVAREQLMPTGRSSKALDVTLNRLRTALEEAGVPDRIVAVRSRGFVLADPADDPR